MQRAGSRASGEPRVKGATRGPLLPTSPRLLVPTDSSDAARSMAIHTAAPGKKNLLTTAIRYARITPRILRYASHIESRARAGCLSFFHFLHFDVRRIDHQKLFSLFCYQKYHDSRKCTALKLRRSNAERRQWKSLLFAVDLLVTISLKNASLGKNASKRRIGFRGTALAPMRLTLSLLFGVCTTTVCIIGDTLMCVSKISKKHFHALAKEMGRIELRIKGYRGIAMRRQDTSPIKDYSAAG
ncbi:hypothetical protein DBV15_05854 [Temnothorax longispinosus]|uniref:Uncharacterized protein n=1 Tax=Temnothorax longispinosus TaxID=300112 RepID=A0A4S2JQR2_9HYME|nr:hypothetical protein DBV15_05854 [Temnothorax longispinosus]